VGELLQGYIVRTSSRDPITIVVVTALLIVVAGVASIVSARRAAKVDPVLALRAD
jgi:putative ABC transport system permease protein